MLHRFADPELGNAGDDLTTLRRHLAWLRRQNYRLVSMGELMTRMASDPKAGDRAVCMTVDDGYADFGSAAPIFAEFDCPVTVFVSSDFVDRRTWYWWDRIEFAVEASDRREWTVELATTRLRFRWHDPASRGAAAHALAESLTRVSDAERLSALSQIAAQSSVEIPEQAPAKYAPMSWDDIRRLADAGVTFGPHSVSHPILSRTSDEQSVYEIEESWRRVRAETSGACPVFCYPNGQPGDFQEREISTARAIGLLGAVATHPGYVTRFDFSFHNPDGRFRLPRMPWPERHQHLVQIVSGIERAKLILRGS
jgi:peptidoglycan/xylan/chitin deacetylase (PgdA/CDA1 family)